MSISTLNQAKQLCDSMGARDLQLLRTYISSLAVSSPTSVAGVCHVTIVGDVPKPQTATAEVGYIEDRQRRVTKAQEYRRHLAKIAATYCLYTGHGFVACFLGEEMNLSDRSDGDGGRVTDGRVVHHTMACRGGTDSQLRADFTFADGVIEHTLLYQKSLTVRAMQVVRN
jgi:hypothetical protein